MIVNLSSYAQMTHTVHGEIFAVISSMAVSDENLKRENVTTSNNWIDEYLLRTHVSGSFLL